MRPASVRHRFFGLLLSAALCAGTLMAAPPAPHTLVTAPRFAKTHLPLLPPPRWRLVRPPQVRNSPSPREATLVRPLPEGGWRQALHVAPRPAPLLLTASPHRNVPAHYVTHEPAQVDRPQWERRVKALEREVQALDRTLTRRDHFRLEDLERLHARVAQARADRTLLHLYQAFLPTDDGTRFPQPAALENLVQLLARRLFEAEVTANHYPSSVSSRGRRQTLERLQALGRQVETWRNVNKS